MRKVQDKQLKLGEIDISKIRINPKSRDEIPQLLRGLQYIYCDKAARQKIFSLLEEHLGSATGRPGMDLWKILVLGSLRLNSNIDYDKVKELADQHNQVREMMGHAWLDRSEYPLQTIIDNASLLTPELLAEINGVVVPAGHTVFKKKPEEKLRGKCDTFVHETDVHFPTDINLLYDAVRKAVELTAKLCGRNDVPGWRQADSLLKKFRAQLHLCEKLKRSASKKQEKQEKKELQIKLAHAEYLAQAQKLIERVSGSLAETLLKSNDLMADAVLTGVIDKFADKAKLLIDLTERRTQKGETIPHEEKIFSVFEEHTEWICKGKAGTPQELGLRVGIVTDQYGFILTHSVMQKIVDSVAGKELLLDAKKHFPDLCSCSFDQGFWTVENMEEFKKIVDVPAMMKKGKLSQADHERQESEEFRKARKGHQAVESSINALENHGLDRCLDHGIKGFKRYVAIAVTARNIQLLGAELIKQERKQLERSKKIKAGIERKRQMAQAA